MKKGTINIYNEKFYKDYLLYIKHNFIYAVSNNEKEELVIKYQLNKVRNIKNKMRVGSALVYLGDSKIHEEAIYIKER